MVSGQGSGGVDFRVLLLAVSFFHGQDSGWGPAQSGHGPSRGLHSGVWGFWIQDSADTLANPARRAALSHTHTYR